MPTPTEKTKTFREAFIELQSELPTLSKSADNPYFKSKYVPLEAIVETIRPILKKHGFGYTQMPTTIDGQPALETTLFRGGNVDQVTSTMLLMLKSPDPQGQGSAITYARRYALMAMLGIVGDEDDDGNKATDEAKKTITKKQQDELVMLLEQLGRPKEAYESKYGKLTDILASDFTERKTQLENLVEQHSASNA